MKLGRLFYKSLSSWCFGHTLMNDFGENQTNINTWELSMKIKVHSMMFFNEHRLKIKIYQIDKEGKLERMIKTLAGVFQNINRKSDSQSVLTFSNLLKETKLLVIL